MPTIEEVQEQLAKFGAFGSFGVSKEVSHLPYVLSRDEKIYACARGFMDNSTWLIVCTGTRVVLLDKGFFYGLKVQEIPLKSVSSVSHSTGMMSGEIVFTVSGSRMVIKQVDKGATKWFVDVVRWACDELNRPRPAAATVAQSQGDLVSQLERLGALREKGLLTEEEFAQQKERLLAGL